MLKTRELPSLMLKRLPTNGERDLLQTLDQFFHFTKRLTLMIQILMNIDSVLKLMLLKKDKINITLEFSGATNSRRRLMLGEVFHTPQLRRNLDSKNCLKEELFQMVIHSTSITLRPPSRTPMTPLRLPDQLQLPLKRLLTHGERDLLQTPDQFSLYPKLERFQMDMLSTTVISKILF
jgi:hypothetical protein